MRSALREERSGVAAAADRAGRVARRRGGQLAAPASLNMLRAWSAVRNVRDGRDGLLPTHAAWVEGRRRLVGCARVSETIAAQGDAIGRGLVRDVR